MAVAVAEVVVVVVVAVAVHHEMCRCRAPTGRRWPRRRRCPLVRRLLARGRGADDSRDVIEHRLAVYESKTRPMLDYYAERETVVVVDGAQPPDAVTIRLLAALEAQRRIRR